MLSAAELERMQETLNESLPDEAIILAGGSMSSDGGGNYTETFVASGTVPCRIVAASSQEEFASGGRMQEVSDWLVTLPSGTDLNMWDRLAIGGGTFSITAIRSPRSYELSCRVEVANVPDE